MKEVTMVTTCEITEIATVSDEDAALLQANLTKVKHQVRKQIEGDLGADNVYVRRVQLFVRDVPDGNDVK
jgi:hypothetical protein